MKPVILYFPDVISLAEFILAERVSGVETNNNSASIKGHLSKNDINKACEQYGASLTQFQTS